MASGHSQLRAIPIWVPRLPGAAGRSQASLPATLSGVKHPQGTSPVRPGRAGCLLGSTDMYVSPPPSAHIPSTAETWSPRKSPRRLGLHPWLSGGDTHGAYLAEGRTSSQQAARAQLPGLWLPPAALTTALSDHGPMPSPTPDLWTQMPTAVLLLPSQSLSPQIPLLSQCLGPPPGNPAPEMAQPHQLREAFW